MKNRTIEKYKKKDIIWKLYILAIKGITMKLKRW
jgi:hypothetical protein